MASAQSDGLRKVEAPRQRRDAWTKETAAAGNKTVVAGNKTAAKGRGRRTRETVVAEGKTKTEVAESRAEATESKSGTSPGEGTIPSTHPKTPTTPSGFSSPSGARDAARSRRRREFGAVAQSSFCHSRAASARKTSPSESSGRSTSTSVTAARSATETRCSPSFPCAPLFSYINVRRDFSGWFFQAIFCVGFQVLHCSDLNIQARPQLFVIRSS